MVMNRTLPSKVQRKIQAEADFDSGAAGRKAMELGLVVHVHCRGAHIMVDDGTDDRRLVEWWPGTKKGLVRIDPLSWTHFSTADEVLDAAVASRSSPGFQGIFPKKPRELASEAPAKKSTKRNRKRQRSRIAKRRARGRKAVAAAESDRAFHARHCD